MIRRFNPADTDTLLSIWEAANALAHPFLSADFVSTVRRDMRDVYLPNAETWVFESGGEAAGFISMIDTEIGGLFLEPSYHGKGFGRAMVDAVVAERGALRVEVFADNAVGRKFYEAYGFLPVSRYTHGPSGQVTIKMAMPG